MSGGRIPQRTWSWLWHTLAILLAITYAFNAVSSAKLYVKKRAHQVLQSDSRQYYVIAKGIAEGDLGMSYVKKEGLAHRQPLFPMILAPFIKPSGKNVLPLLLVNISVMAVLILVAYGCLWKLLASGPAALAGAAFFADDGMLRYVATHRLLTEPLFVLLSFLVSICLVRYIASNRPSWFLAACAWAGLSYLSRVNGLFVMISLLAVALLHDLTHRKLESPGMPVDRRRMVGRYVMGMLIMVIVTVPSWLPRLVYHGNPMYLGRLGTRLWADTRLEAKNPNAQYLSASYYFATHDAVDMIKRQAYGLRRVYVDGGFRSGKLWFTLVIIGLGMSLAARRRPYQILFLFLFAQMLPLAWSAQNLTSVRIPHTALLPVAGIFVALAVSEMLGLFRRRFRPQAQSSDISPGLPTSHLPISSSLPSPRGA